MIVELKDVQRYDDTRMLATVDVTDDDGTVRRVAHVMPYDAAEWRIAEYGLDPTDTDTVVDVLLFETHTPVHDDVPAGMGLHEAPTIDDAREALLAAVRARKATSTAKRQARTAERLGRLTGAALKAAQAQQDPEPAVRARLVGLCVVDDDVVAAKRDHVARTREAIAAQSAASRPTPTSADRAAVFAPLPQTKEVRRDVLVDHAPADGKARPQPDHG